ncbi:uncharacterized protein LOC144145126 [Haemaphysalis longicornis]
MSSSTTDDSTGEPEENTSGFGVFDGDSSIISLGLDDSDQNLASEDAPTKTVRASGSEKRGGGEQQQQEPVGVQRARLSWPCTSNQTVVAAAAVFQGMLILLTLTAINKYGIFNDIQQVGYYEKPDIQQPETSGADDYYGDPGSLEQDRPRPMATGSPATTLGTQPFAQSGYRLSNKSVIENKALYGFNTSLAEGNARSSGGGRALLCLFADTFEGDFPAHLCSHLVFMNTVLDLQAQLVRPNSAADQGRAVLQRFINQRREQQEVGGCRFLVSLWEARVTDTYRDLFTDWARGTRAATVALGWLQRTGLDGLALLDLALTSDSGPDFLNIFKVLRAVMGRYVTLVFGFYLAESYEGKEQTRVVKTLHQIAKFVNFTVFEAHDARPVSCKVFMPNAYQKRPDDKDAPDKTISQSLKWSAGPSELYQRLSGSLCVSLTLAAFRFIVHVGPGHLGARCYNYYPASITQVWFLLHGGLSSRCQHSDGCKSVGVKGIGSSCRYKYASRWNVNLSVILDDYPAVCVALYHADLEDYGGVCDPGEPFARITAVRQILDSKPSTPIS